MTGSLRSPLSAGGKRKCLRTSFVAAAVVATAVWVTPTAVAADAPESVADVAAEAVDVVATVEPETQSAQELVTVDGGVGVSDGALEVVAPSLSDEPVSVGGAAADVGIGLPGDGVEAVVVGEQVVYSDVAEETTVVVQVLEDSGVQILTVMGSDEAPTEQRYDLDLPVGAELIENPDGSVTVWENGEEVGLFEVPWASDADGAALPTGYTIDGDTLVQTTDVTGAAFPVVADPAYYADCGIVTCTRWVSVASTRSVYLNRFNSTSSTWQLIHGAKCAISLIGGALVGAGCAVWSAWLINDMTTNLEYAGQNKRCLVVKYSRQLGFAWPTDYQNTSPANTWKCYWS